MSDTQNPSAPPCEIVQRLRAASLLDGWAWLNEAADAIERPEPGIIMAPIDIDFLSTRFWHKVEKFGDD